MRNQPLRRVPQLLPTLVLAGVSMAAWAAWLGWDQHYDVQPDGTSTGPYEAWQVIGLVLTVLVPVYWAASRRYVASAVLGTTAALTIAAFLDWSNDSTGQFMVGVVMVMMGSLAATALASNIITSVRRPPSPTARIEP